MHKQELYTRYRTYVSTIDKHLASLFDRREPALVYEPITYVFSTGGKRLRAVLVLLACEAVGGRMREALSAAVAMEMLHNFTLVHDDVMDNADLRRGLPTVHQKWDETVAILVETGDNDVVLVSDAIHSMKSMSRLITIDMIHH